MKKASVEVGLVLALSMFGAGVREAAANELVAIAPGSRLEAMAMEAGHEGGVWAFSAPPAGIKGEFDGYDPIGLASGQLIKTDCSVNWRDDDGRVYCFSTPPSLVYFEDWPHANIARARKAWKTLSKEVPGS